MMRRFSLFLQLTVLLGGLLATEPVRAEYTSRLDSVQQIEEVVVTGNRLNEIVPAQKLDGKVLEKLNSFSVADAIRYFSGVQIKDYGGIGGLKTVNVRSMGTNHMGVFYDGIQLGNAQNGQIDLGKFSLDNMEEISLYNGQKSDIFQSAKDFGSSGSIYLRAKRPRFKEGETYHVQATMKAGSFGLANPVCAMGTETVGCGSPVGQCRIHLCHGQIQVPLPQDDGAGWQTGTGLRYDCRTAERRCAGCPCGGRSAWRIGSRYVERPGVLLRFGTGNTRCDSQ